MSHIQTVRELIELLEEFGDHLKIAVVIGTTEDDVVALEDVDFNSDSGLLELYIDKNVKVKS